ncbi:NACHT domain-containing NTPase [Streptomyces sp. IB201691-2A2]|uniref:NACHT domain-containing protein n=1 Tax=Streptomyces sp. IB201691-2A2 TaxID=2561920 RepID=UPI00163D8D94|nr:NACHT domain-containing protein [Streptomyces sp. IB201691-2A2]
MIARHPVLAVGALALYELLVVLVGFAGKVFGDLQGRWVKRAADAVDRWVQWRTSRFEREYRQHVYSTHRFIDLKGLATRGDHTPGLEEVFIDVSLVPGPVHAAAQESLAGPVLTPVVPERRPVDEFLNGPQGACLAVIGAPGTGKTTLLKHLALGLTSGPQSRQRPRRDLPVLLYLRDHAQAVTDNPGLTLPEIVTASLGSLQADEPDGWFEQQLRDGRCLVLLDGLDEVAREDDRRQVSSWAEKQIERYEGNDFVLTSRPHGYRTAALNRARVLQVRRFTGEQISRFLHGWYQSIERLSTGVDDSGVAARADAEAQDLLARLRGRPVLYDLAANPLLLTMIANVHRYRGALPGSRAELYAEICQVLLWRRAEAKNVPAEADEVPGAKKEVVLRELAYTMMTAGRRDIGADRVADLLRPALSRVSVTTAADAFLASVVASGLLVERERGLYAFAHLTLQEHLAALHIQHHRLTDTLIAGVNDDWWRETTLLYAARTDPASIVEACLVANTTRALALAFDCAEQATEFHPDTAARLDALRQQALTEPIGSARRRFMTAVTVTRQLQETVRLTDDTQVIARPVTCELYRLFAADIRGAPDTDEGGRHEAALAELTDPAVGIRRDEALALVRWVNELLPDGTAYRLPTQEEVADPAFALTTHSAHHSAWHTAADPDAPPSLWIPNAAAHPWTSRLDVPAGLPLVLTSGVLATTIRTSPHEPALARDRDRDRILAVAVAVALARALARALDPSRALALDGFLPVARAVARAVAVARALSRTRATVRDRDRDRALDLDLDLVLDRALDRALALARDPDLDLDLDLDLDRDSVLARALTLDRDLARALDLVLDPDRDLARDHDLARALDLVLDPDRDLDRVLDRILDLDLAVEPDGGLGLLYRVSDLEREQISVALPVNALLRELVTREPDPPSRRRTRPSSFLDRAVDVLRSQSSEQPQLYTVYADQIVPTLEEANMRVLAALHLGNRAEGHIRGLAASTAPLTASLPDVQGKPGRIRAAYLEVAVLILAAAADQDLGDSDTANLYRTVAAGIAILRHRADGSITPTETLVLARS